MQAKHTENIRLTHEERIVFRCSPQFSSDLTSRFLVFSGVFKWQNKEFTDVFRHSAWVFSRFLGQRTTRKCRETACSPTFTHRLMRCFPSFQNFFLQENAPFSVSNALIFAHLLRFQCDLMLECNLVLYSLVFSFKILTFVVAVLFFPAPAIGALNDK